MEQAPRIVGSVRSLLLAAAGWLAAATGAGADARAALGIPAGAPETSWTVKSRLPVNARTVEDFLDLTPLFKQLEDEQLEILEESHRSRSARKSRRLAHEMTEILREAERRAGMTHAEFRALRRDIRSVHRALYRVRQTRASLEELLARWDREKADGRASDELFSRAREILTAEKNRAEREYQALPELARSAVESWDAALVAAFKIRRSSPDREEDRDYELPPAEPLKQAQVFQRPRNPLFKREPGETRAPPLGKEDFAENFPLECHPHGEFGP